MREPAEREPAPFVLRPATGEPIPLLVSVPHAGTGVPEDVLQRFTAVGRMLGDTDWFLDQLYGFVPEIGGVLLAATQSRYVVDLNRPADGTPLYPGRDETGLVPTTTFGGEPIYGEGAHGEGAGPDRQEIEARRDRFWVPYHECLRDQLRRLKEAFGYACLWDGHSIRSEVPRFFDGQLEDLLLGTADGVSCDGARLERVRATFADAGFPVRCNQTFKGGFITRSSGDPNNCVHAIQLEMPWACYMDETPPWRWQPDRAPELVAAIRAALLAFAAPLD